MPTSERKDEPDGGKRPAYLRTRATDEQKKCPDCKQRFDQEDYDTHRYLAHGEDRRKTKEQQTPPPPEKREKRQTTQPKPEGPEDTPKKKTNPWFRRPQ